MLETNKNLSIALERADTRCFNLEKKVDKIKKYHKMFKYADEIICRVTFQILEFLTSPIVLLQED